METRVRISGIRNLNNFHLVLHGNDLEVTDSLKSHTFSNACQHSYDQALKTIYLLMKRVQHLILPIDLQLQLFNHTVVPFHLYDSEILGFKHRYY